MGQNPVPPVNIPIPYQPKCDPQTVLGAPRPSAVPRARGTEVGEEVPGAAEFPRRRPGQAVAGGATAQGRGKNPLATDCGSNSGFPKWVALVSGNMDENLRFAPPV